MAFLCFASSSVDSLFKFLLLYSAELISIVGRSYLGFSTSSKSQLSASPQASSSKDETTILALFPAAPTGGGKFARDVISLFPKDSSAAGYGILVTSLFLSIKGANCFFAPPILPNLAFAGFFYSDEFCPKVSEDVIDFAFEAAKPNGSNSFPTELVIPDFEFDAKDDSTSC